ncbi:uncharacterized protein LOC110368348 [Fundulus heteroclitus]|uniref:uncharacterized protein LOC110368348 n=1 Tax=Fundulus heteroclitus TaxID=8078 RepID=UPI00165C77BF|nr:uncharacterized protein LOC110368348 [Fundulus heteroclitus]
MTKTGIGVSEGSPEGKGQTHRGGGGASPRRQRGWGCLQPHPHPQPLHPAVWEILRETLQWLLENDVGYAVNLVSSHQNERERTGSQSPLIVNKDALLPKAYLHYTSVYPDFMEAVRFHRAFEEVQTKSSHPGQKGWALVGFGDFRYETLESLYNSEDPQKIRVVDYLQRTSPAPGSHMEKAVGYVRRRDRQRAASSSTTGGAAPPKLASHFAAFVSSCRSLSGVEIQAALKKLGSSAKPAVPAETQDQLLPPSDEELMRASGDAKKSSDKNAEAGPSTSSLPQGEPAVSAELGDPTDQELLEASAEGRASVQPLDPPEPPSRQDAQLRRDPLSAAELLPESWRAALSAEQQDWIGRTLFMRDCLGRSRLTANLNLWWSPPQPRPVYHQPPASRPLLLLSAVLVDASQGVASAADLPPASVQRLPDKGWAVQDHPEGGCPRS